MTEKRIRSNLKANNNKVKRICRFCNLEFVAPRRSSRTVCSKRCPAMLVSYICTVCNTKTQRPRCYGEGKFCSDRCRRTWYYINGVEDLLPVGMHYPVNPKSKKRKARVRKGDTINKLDVFEFFNWTCIVCDDIIDRRLRWPHPQSASLDHIVPLAEGGTHTWDNVAPAHLLCNTNKDCSLDNLDKYFETFRKIVEEKKETVNGFES